MNIEVNKVLDLMAARIGHLEKENALLKAQVLSMQNTQKAGDENVTKADVEEVKPKAK